VKEFDAPEYNVVLNADKFRNETGWSPRVSLREGIIRKIREEGRRHVSSSTNSGRKGTIPERGMSSSYGLDVENRGPETEDDYIVHEVPSRGQGLLKEVDVMSLVNIFYLVELDLSYINKRVEALKISQRQKDVLGQDAERIGRSRRGRQSGSSVLTPEDQKKIDVFNQWDGYKAVDVGTGHGEYLAGYKIVYPGRRIIGFETNPVFRDREKDIIIYDGRETGLDEASVNEFIFNMPDPDQVENIVQGVVREAYRILKPSGIFAMTIEDIPLDVKFNIIRLMEKEGFDISARAKGIYPQDLRVVTVTMLSIDEIFLFKGNKSKGAVASSLVRRKGAVPKRGLPLSSKARSSSPGKVSLIEDAAHETAEKLLKEINWQLDFISRLGLYRELGLVRDEPRLIIASLNDERAYAWRDSNSLVIDPQNIWKGTDVREIIMHEYSRWYRNHYVLVENAMSADSPELIAQVKNDEGYRMALEGTIISIIGIERKDVVVDIGTMYGNLAAVARYYTDNTIYGIDLSQESLKIAKKVFPELDIKFQVQDATRLQFEDGMMDVVMSGHFFKRLLSYDKIRVLKEMKRVLKIGGRLALFEYAHDPAAPSYVWDQEEWRVHLRETGFEDSSIYIDYSYQLSAMGTSIVDKDFYVILALNHPVSSSVTSLSADRKAIKKAVTGVKRFLSQNEGVIWAITRDIFSRVGGLNIEEGEVCDGFSCVLCRVLGAVSPAIGNGMKFHIESGIVETPPNLRVHTRVKGCWNKVRVLFLDPTYVQFDGSFENKILAVDPREEPYYLRPIDEVMHQEYGDKEADHVIEYVSRDWQRYMKEATGGLSQLSRAERLAILYVLAKFIEQGETEKVFTPDMVDVLHRTSDTIIKKLGSVPSSSNNYFHEVSSSIEGLALDSDKSHGNSRLKISPGGDVATLLFSPVADKGNRTSSSSGLVISANGPVSDEIMDNLKGIGFRQLVVLISLDLAHFDYPMIIENDERITIVMPTHVLKRGHWIEPRTIRPLRSNGIDTQKAEKWMLSHSTPELQEFAQTILNNVRHVPQEEFEQSLGQSVDQFNNTLREYEKYVVLLPPHKLQKSNKWVLDLAKEKGLRWPQEIVTYDQFDRWALGNNFLEPSRYSSFNHVDHVVFPDDGSFSGEQITFAAMQVIKHGLTPHFIIPYVSDEAKNIIAGIGAKLYTSDEGRIVHAEEILGDFRSVSQRYFGGRKVYILPGQAILFFDHKAPDHLSTISSLEDVESDWPSKCISVFDGAVFQPDGSVIQGEPFIPETVPPYKLEYLQWYIDSVINGQEISGIHKTPQSSSSVEGEEKRKEREDGSEKGGLFLIRENEASSSLIGKFVELIKRKVRPQSYNTTIFDLDAVPNILHNPRSYYYTVKAANIRKLLPERMENEFKSEGFISVSDVSPDHLEPSFNETIAVGVQVPLESIVVIARQMADKAGTGDKSEAAISEFVEKHENNYPGNILFSSITEKGPKKLLTPEELIRENLINNIFYDDDTKLYSNNEKVVIYDENLKIQRLFPIVTGDSQRDEYTLERLEDDWEVPDVFEYIKSQHLPVIFLSKRGVKTGRMKKHFLKRFPEFDEVREDVFLRTPKISEMIGVRQSREELGSDSGKASGGNRLDDNSNKAQGSSQVKKDMENGDSTAIYVKTMPSQDHPDRNRSKVYSSLCESPVTIGNNL